MIRECYVVHLCMLYLIRQWDILKASLPAGIRFYLEVENRLYEIGSPIIRTCKMIIRIEPVKTSLKGVAVPKPRVVISSFCSSMNGHAEAMLNPCHL